jgi:metal-responsive CopG/Arc/MetJ family transcriptional regulator
MPTGERRRKITISLPEELVEYADHRAKELNASRSQVIGMVLSAVMAQEEEQLAAEGYRFYAQEASEFADAASQAVAEAWTDNWLPTEPSE